MSTNKLLEMLRQHIRDTYSDNCFRKQQCLDIIDLIEAKLRECPKK